MFPEESREFTLKDADGKRHQADVFLDEFKTVIEFQHSMIQDSRFNDRNSFYTALGNRVIWVFDVISDNENGKLSYRSEIVAEWLKPLKALDSFSFKKSDVDVFLQIEDKDEETSDGFCLLKVEGVDSKGFELFQYSKYSKKEFLEFIKGCDKEAKKTMEWYDIADALYPCMNKKREQVFYGCPKSKTGTVGKQQCLDCRWHRKRTDQYKNKQDACVEKLRKTDFFQYDIDEIDSDPEGRVQKVYYYTGNGVDDEDFPNNIECLDFPEQLPMLGHSIPYLWDKYPKAGIIIFSMIIKDLPLEYYSNYSKSEIITQREVKMNRNQRDEGIRTGIWPGWVKSNGFKRFPKNAFKEVFNATDDVWTVAWWAPPTNGPINGKVK